MYINKATKMLVTRQGICGMLVKTNSNSDLPGKNYKFDLVWENKTKVLEESITVGKHQKRQINKRHPLSKKTRAYSSSDIRTIL